MKKFKTFLYIACVAFCVALTACNKSAETATTEEEPEVDDIQQYEAICNQIIEAMNNGNEEEYDRLYDELESLTEELDSLSADEFNRLQQINAKFNEQFMQFQDAFSVDRLHDIITTAKNVTQAEPSEEQTASQQDK
ncbi:MAG: hypothetical protein K2K82_09475 [Muribaculaceae bacterium]|nr:hypothetical protein [Muribaculaceae bacterium]